MRFLRRPAPRSITLYGKPGCHLCEEARALLEELSSRFRLEITEIDIRSDPQLFRRYDILIPVIVIDEGVELEAPIDRQSLFRALRS